MTALRAVLTAALTASATAVGPCHSPLNHDFETPCAKTLASRGGVVVRSVGEAQHVTLIATPPLYSGFPYTSALLYCAEAVFQYFGCPTQPEDALASSAGCNLTRTAPLTLRRAPAGAGYVMWMAASPTEFPGGAGTLPAPSRDDEVSPVALGQRLIAVVNFTTAAFPEEEDWNAACAQLNVHGALPAGFELDTVGAGPLGGANGTLALWQVEANKGPWVSECWVPVLRK